MAFEQVGMAVTIEAQLERFDRAMKNSGVIVDTVATGMDKATKRAATSFNRLEGALNPAAAATRRYERDVQKVKVAVDSGAVSNERAAQVLARLGDQYERSAQTGAGFTRFLGQGARGSRQMGMAVQNAGFQVGDFAVQIASGQNPLRAFIQQGTQLVSMFGPWGAVIGAAGAVFGALATTFIDAGDSAKKAEEAAADLEKRLDSLKSSANGTADALRNLRAGTDDFTLAGITKEIADFEKQQTQLQDLFSIQNPRVRQRKIADVLGIDPGEARERLEDVTKRLEELRATRDRLVSDLSNLRTANSLLTGQKSPATEEYFAGVRAQVDATRDRIDALKSGAKEADDAVAAIWARVNNRLQSSMGTGSLVTGGPSPESLAVFDRANANTDRYRETLERLKKAMEDGKAVELSVRTEREQHADTLERLDQLLMQGAISQETYNRAAQNANRTLMQSDPVFKGFSSGLDSMSTGLFRFADASESASERARNALVGMLNDISEEFARRAITNPLLNLLFDAGLPTLTGLFGSGGGINIASNALPSGSVLPPSVAAGVRHSGGMADRGLTRTVPAALFAGAPRYHSGGVVAPGEVPAILKRDEEVLTRSDPRHRYNFGRGSGAASGPTFNIDARGADRQGMAELSATVRALNGKINRIDATLEPRAVKSMVDTRRRNPKIFSG
ncbi:hypothetical protein HH303_18925 [Rhodospirillaceae bacterium KN72]|uniref:Bacteriophage tail tape measure N-terminal domain-containing protein n=1 Tax=Pacificispira spongiicola TaxID=2729598 RepID=A0A7Y0E3H5_9PROT|nr:phage tail length tape measure family protein [Pacificispira spongiicola]NMM46572.1 hypothetical protein [Pacificispira spongiicola]